MPTADRRLSGVGGQLPGGAAGAHGRRPDARSREVDRPDAAGDIAAAGQPGDAGRQACGQATAPEAWVSDATVGRRIGIARQMFRVAFKWKLISDNPFTDVHAGSQTNKARQFFIPRDVAQKVIDACPDAQWRLLFALSRYGGLRCPSEHLALKWGDITWNTVDENKMPRGDGRIKVTSPKTEHHAGGDHRFIPMFPELEPYLQAVFDQAEEGAEFVITRYRDTTVNLRTQLLRIMAKAGVKPWPKLWHNLRATRQTELAEKFPLHVVCAWIGNSREVAMSHYLQVTDAHFGQAVAGPVKSAAQNPAQYGAVLPGTGLESPTPKKQKSPVFPGDSASYELLQNIAMGDTGLEPVTSRV